MAAAAGGGGSSSDGKGLCEVGGWMSSCVVDRVPKVCYLGTMRAMLLVVVVLDCCCWSVNFVVVFVLIVCLCEVGASSTEFQNPVTTLCFRFA